MKNLTQIQIAMHEAGHAVAHVRMNVDLQGNMSVSIVPDNNKGSLGRAYGPGCESCYDVDDAEKVVICYLAGYATLIAAGYTEEQAEVGCDNDFSHAARLIEFWALEPLESQKRHAVAFMSQPENRKAVDLLRRWLMANPTLDGDLMQILIEVADGEITNDDLRRFLTCRQAGLGYSYHFPDEPGFHERP